MCKQAHSEVPALFLHIVLCDTRVHKDSVLGWVESSGMAGGWWKRDVSRNMVLRRK